MNRYVYLLGFALLIMASMAPDVHCVENHIEFRVVLNKEELNGKEFDAVKNGRDILYVWKLYYLSDRDLEKVEIKRSATRVNSPILVLKFNKDGKKRLYRFTKKFPKRQVAIFVEGKLITAPLIWIPHFMGDKVVTDWPGSEKDLLEFAYKVNDANPSVISLYIDEQVKYQETAAEEWAKYYTDLNNYIEEKRRHFSEDVRITEASRDTE